MRRSSLLTSLGLALAGCQEMLPTDLPNGPIHPRFALTAGPVTPVFGGTVTSPILTIDNRPGDQVGPRIGGSGDLACYDDDANRQVRYHRFSTGANAAVPSLAGVWDLRCATDGNRVAFIRFSFAPSEKQVHVFDPGTSALTPIDPQPGVDRDETAIAGNTVVFVHRLSAGTSEIRGADITSPASSHLVYSNGTFDSGVRLAPNGNVLGWHYADLDGFLYTLLATRTAGTWSAPAPINAGSPASFAGTDGTYLVFNAADVNGFEAIFVQEVTGGPIMQLDLSGSNIATSIDNGVVSLLHTDDGSNWDVMVYNIATNTLLRVTTTPGYVNGQSVAVLPDGNIRVVWQAGTGGGLDILSTTFTPAGGPVEPVYTHIFKHLLPWPMLNVANPGSVIPVRFRPGNNLAPPIFAPGFPAYRPIECLARIPIGRYLPADSPGNRGLSYDPLTQEYTFLWKTDPAFWLCHELTLVFTNGTAARAAFYWNGT